MFQLRYLAGEVAELAQGAFVGLSLRTCMESEHPLFVEMALVVGPLATGLSAVLAIDAAARWQVSLANHTSSKAFFGRLHGGLLARRFVTQTPL